MPTLSLDDATPATFVGAVGDTFRVAREGAPFVLADVRPLAPTPDHPRPEPFALHFTCPGPVRAQGIVELEHDDLGVLALFVVPIGTVEGVATYEAVIN